MNEILNIVFYCCFLPLVCVVGLFVSLLLSILIGDMIADFKQDVKRWRSKNDKRKK